MKSLLRVWSLALDLVMLVMLLAAPVKAPQKTLDRGARRAEREAFLREAAAMRGEIMSPKAALARVKERRLPGLGK